MCFLRLWISLDKKGEISKLFGCVHWLYFSGGDLFLLFLNSHIFWYMIVFDRGRAFFDMFLEINHVILQVFLNLSYVSVL